MIKRSLLLLFFLITSSTWAQDSESERLLLNKINSLEKEIQTLLSQLEEINYKLNRIEDTQQLRYVDLDKRIHELEGILLVQEEIEGTNIDELDPLAGLIEEDDASNEFDLWSDSLQLIEDGRSSMDVAAGEKKFIKATEISMREYALLPIHHVVATWAARKGISYELGALDSTFLHFIR